MFNKNSFSAPKRPKKPKAEKVKAEKSPKTSTPKAGFSFGGGSKGFSGKAPKTSKAGFGGGINLTEQQKKIVIIAAIAVVVVIAAVVVGVVIANSGNSSGGGIFGGGNGNSGSGSGDSQGTAEIDKFYISSEPSKTVYYVGDLPNYSGLSVYVHRDSSEFISYTSDPEAFTITGFDSSAPAESQTITVEYMGQTDTFTVKILEIPVSNPVLQSIYLDPMPKTEYKLGEDFEIEGVNIIAVYDDESTVSVPLSYSNIYGFGGIDAPGEYEITVKYFDANGGYATTTFTVTITE